MSDSLLEKVRENRDAILLSEIGAYLHLLGRFSIDFIESQAIDATSSFNYKQIFEDNTFFENTGLEKTLTSTSWKSRLNSFSAKNKGELSSNKVKDFSDFVRKHTWGDNPRGLCRVLADAHGIVSAIDKMLTGEKECKQKKDHTFGATAFGYEEEIELTENPNLKQELLKKLDRHLKKINREKFDDGKYDTYRGFVDLMKKYYPKTIGETRRPINEVSLLDYAYPIASLMKSNLGKIIIEGWYDPKGKSKWRILKVNIDVVELLSKGLKLGDIIGYKNEINDIFENIKELIEYSCPFGNEIYRDSTGIYFTIPALSKSNSEKLERELEIEIEKYDILDFSLQLEVTEESRSLTFLAKELKKARNDIVFHNIGNSHFFSISDDDGKEICPICRIRPISQNEEICRKCQDRRIKRGKNWLEDKRKTIWLDEIADHNDRVALVVGKFDIIDWLSGEFLRTLRARTFKDWRDENKGLCEKLSISSIEDLRDNFSSLFTSGFSKNRKELCKSFIDRKPPDVEKDFWEPVAERDATGRAISVKDPSERAECLIKLFFTKHPSIARLRRIWGTTSDFINKDIIGILNGHEYAKNTDNSDIRNKRLELKLNIQQSSILNRGAAYQLEIGTTPITIVCEDPSSGGFVIIDNLQLITQTLKKNLDEICDFLQGRKAVLQNEKLKMNVRITHCTRSEKEYFPYAEIFSFPERFMFLIPAWDSLEIINKIMEEYEKEFSKVIDRLPLHLGIVFFHRRMPLFSAMDAGKRILKAFEKQENDTEAEILDISISGQGKTQIFGVEKLKKQAFTWEMDTQTKDPGVPDWWYPYVRIKDNDKSDLPIVPPNIYVGELKEGDKIVARIQLFCFIFLESSAMRFEAGKRIFTQNKFKEMSRIWEIFGELTEKGILTQTKLKNVETLLYSKLEEWNNHGHLVDTFIRTALRKDLSLNESDENFELLYNSIIDGTFFETLELNLKILKRKLEVRK